MIISSSSHVNMAGSKYYTWSRPSMSLKWKLSRSLSNTLTLRCSSFTTRCMGEHTTRNHQQCATCGVPHHAVVDVWSPCSHCAAAPTSGAASKICRHVCIYACRSIAVPSPWTIAWPPAPPPTLGPCLVMNSPSSTTSATHTMGHGCMLLYWHLRCICWSA